MTLSKAEADEALRKAIIDHAEAYELFEEGEVLDQFGIISAWQQMNPTTETGARYTTQFHRDSIPDHIARGLFHSALFFLDKE